MDYPYEQLGDESFQELCQSLLLRAFPEVRVFPVGQPDGGRDATAFFLGGDDTADRSVIYQVKFARRPEAIQDPVKWIDNAVRGESRKVTELAARGATDFVLITNLLGSAHLDSGQIDRVDVILKEHIPIRSACWWRSDLNRRLDDAWDLKWSYPQLLTGPDLLRVLVESGLHEDKDRRTRAVATFVKDQLQTDREVKFKQVELQNQLLDLFVDVPAGRSRRSEEGLSFSVYSGRMRGAITIGDFVESSPEDPETFDWRAYERADGSDGTAHLLLGRDSQRANPRVVVEGAPGQGKSTIAQFVSQIHRMRLLRQETDLAKVDAKYLDGDLKLPVKADLRDFAAWLDGRNPFDPTEQGGHGLERSLESFTAALISHHAGGGKFDADDLRAIFEASPVLLLLDGLDEVADPSSRKEVVDEVIRGVSRLEELNRGLQVVVTSRPTAFQDTPRFPTAYTNYELGSLPRGTIEQYAEQWTTARDLPPREARDLKRFLQSKLEQPHIRDLARNPMQLAILLSLVHSRGSALPDKRTSLYELYMNLFLDRESDKSTIVRDNRALLVRIHQSLAWTLHAQAEAHGGSGSISEPDLEAHVRDFLISEGYGDTRVADLFSGIVERVVAIVSRVQGTYEFEVQPIREYFAAQYLYETAPYSPQSSPQTGTRSDRFRGLIKNPYWQNVARFVAGFYSHGELFSLVDDIKSVMEDGSFSTISHHRVFAASLLGDWVFAQHPRATKAVLELVAADGGLQMILASRFGRPAAEDPLLLAPECGQHELVELCIEELKRVVSRADRSLLIANLLRRNAQQEGGTDIYREQWLAALAEFKGEKRLRWLRLGVQLDCYRGLDRPEFERLTEGLPPAQRWDLVIAAGVEHLYSSDEGARISLVARVGATRQALSFHREPATPLGRLALSIDSDRYQFIFRRPVHASLREVFDRYGFSGHAADDLDSVAGLDQWPDVLEFLKQLEGSLEVSAGVWATSIEPWEKLGTLMEQLVPDSDALSLLAITGAGIRSRTDTCADSPDLSDTTKSLIRRVRYARLRAGNDQWWEGQIQSATADLRVLVLSVFFAWASPRVLIQRLEQTSEIVDGLSARDWSRLHTTAERLRSSLWFARSPRKASFPPAAGWPETNARVALLIMMRASRKTEQALFETYLRNYQGDDPKIVSRRAELALQSARRHPSAWPEALKIAAESTKVGVAEPVGFFRNRPRIPIRVAKEICRDRGAYSTGLFAEAELALRAEALIPSRTVAAVAEHDGWFSQHP